MPDEILKKLLECGVHFGHQTRRWNPKMERYIFGERSGIYIIDLEKTRDCLTAARDVVRDIAAKGGTVLYVGTKKQAKEIIASEAQRAGMPYVNNRWMGGLLTNFETVRKSFHKLSRIEKMEADGTMANLKKKEVAVLTKAKEKLLRDLGGIREMTRLPDAVFIVDTKREEIAVREANRLGLPIIGLVDTNCDPEPIAYPIPGNDDALKSIRFIATSLTESLLEGRRAFLEAETIQKKAAATQAAESRQTEKAKTSPSPDEKQPTDSEEETVKAEAGTGGDKPASAEAEEKI